MNNKYILTVFVFCVFSCNSQKKDSSKNGNLDNGEKVKKESIIPFDSISNKKEDYVTKYNTQVLDSLIESITIGQKKEGGDYVKDSTLKKYVGLILHDSISSFKKLKALDCNDTISYFKGVDLKKNKYFIVLNRIKFKIEKHKINLRKKYQHTWLIDNKSFWGAFRLPKTEFKYFEVYINNNEVDFDKEYFNDIYNPIFCSFKKEDGTDYEYLKCYVSNDSKYLFIALNGGDGGGGYIAIWIFKNGEYHSRVVELAF